MVVAEALEAVGVGGSIVMVVSAGIALYHGRSVLQFAAAAGTYLRVAGLLGFVLVLAIAGVIPGIELSLDLSTLGSLVGNLGDMLPLGAIR